jgi:hypothetical protein
VAGGEQGMEIYTGIVSCLSQYKHQKIESYEARDTNVRLSPVTDLCDCTNKVLRVTKKKTGSLNHAMHPIPEGMRRFYYSEISKDQNTYICKDTRLLRA